MNVTKEYIKWSSSTVEIKHLFEFTIEKALKKRTVNTCIEKNLVVCYCRNKKKGHHAWKRDMASDYLL